MKAEDIRDGDIVEIDYIAEFTKEHINEGKALVLWKGFNHQPLIMRLDREEYYPIWTCYEHISKVVGHIPIGKILKGNATNGDVIKTIFLPNTELHKESEHERRILMVDTWWMTNVVWYDGENAYVSKFILRYDINDCMNPQDEVYIEDYFDGNGEILKYDRCYQIKNLHQINQFSLFQDSTNEKDLELWRAYMRWNEMMFGNNEED